MQPRQIRYLSQPRARVRECFDSFQSLQVIPIVLSFTDGLAYIHGYLTYVCSRCIAHVEVRQCVDRLSDLSDDVLRAGRCKNQCIIPASRICCRENKYINHKNDAVLIIGRIAELRCKSFRKRQKIEPSIIPINLVLLLFTGQVIDGIKNWIVKLLYIRILIKVAVLNQKPSIP